MLEFSANTEELKAYLAGIRAKTSDLTPVFTGYSKYRQQQWAMQFSVGVDPYGKPWMPLTEAAMRAKRKRGEPKLLVASGKLRSSQVRLPGRMVYREVIADKKAVYLHKKRPLLPDSARGIPNSDLRALIRLLQQHL